MRILGKSLVLLFVTLLSDGILKADQFHYANFLIGERAMGLGGAFTAVADDASGIFYNPAGLGFALNSDISGSANAYYSKETVYKDTIGSNNFTEKSSGTANPFFGGLQKLDHIWQGLAAGFAVYVTDNEFKDQDDLFENVNLGGAVLDRYHRTANTRSETLGIALAVAKKFKGGLSLGFGLSYLTATELTQNYQDVIITESTLVQHETVNTRVKLDAGAIETAFGLQYAIGNISLGINAKVRSIINQNLEFAFDKQSVVQNVAQPSQGANVNYSYDDPLDSWPNEYRFGLAWFATTRLLLTVDVTHFSGTNDVEGDGSDAGKDASRQKYGREATTNYAGGLEYYITSSVPVRVGVYTNNDARPEIEKGKQNQMDHIDYMGYSLFFAWVQPNSQVSIGAIYQNGKGEAQKLANNPVIQDVVSNAYTLAISATHSL